MKTEYREITALHDRFTRLHHTESLCRIIERLETKPLRKCLECFGITWQAIAVHWQNSRGRSGNERLNPFGIEVKTLRFDISEY